MYFDWQQCLIWMAKLLLAALLGGAVGFERETHGQAAGLRTNLLVSTGSCLLMMLSLHLPEMFQALDATSNLRIDPGRIASYAVAGMGFLGGGAILKGKGSVRGLTTAASLWLNTGVGLSIGAGYVLPAVFATSISLVILYNLRFAKLILSHDVGTVLCVTCSMNEKPLRRIREILAEYARFLEINFVNYRLDLTSEIVQYKLRVTCRKGAPFGEIVSRLRNEIKGLRTIAWEEGDVP